MSALRALFLGLVLAALAGAPVPAAQHGEGPVDEAAEADHVEDVHDVAAHAGEGPGHEGGEHAHAPEWDYMRLAGQLVVGDRLRRPEPGRVGLPPDEPPGVRARSHGLRVGPKATGSVVALRPNSIM